MSSLIRILVASVPALALVAAAVGCAPPSDDGTPCGRAKTMLGECGVIMPFELSQTCTGTTEAISECIVATGGSCDALANVATHLDQCAARDSGDGVPEDFPQVHADDGGALASDASKPAPADASTSSFDAATSVDASAADATTPVIIDSGADTGTTSAFVFDVSGTIVSGEDQSFQTIRLSQGDYTFAFTSSGAVDVYVRKGYAPTSTNYDCVSSSGGTICTESIATTAVLYVKVHGNAASSFHVTATP